ncbi:MAG: uracil-DNA glycosylase [Candidatus Heimdallarchaeota archaeon]|nr:uracil-DNA glycosylase [Candidatus Heimdallarchaeota archaeon]
MQICIQVSCDNFPCAKINKEGYIIPKIDLDVEKISIIMISEAPPDKQEDYFYAKGEPYYMETTLQLFKDAGYDVSSIDDIINLGVYITTAIKCAKLEYSVPTSVIKNCSEILEKEISLFPNVKAFILNSDVSIRAFNYISKRTTGEKVIPNGSTYKIRNNEFYYEGCRVFPSYILTGKNLLIEKSKRKMIADDIKNAFKFLTD